MCTLEVPTKRWTRDTGYGIRDGGSEVEGVSVLHGPCFLSEWYSVLRTHEVVSWARPHGWIWWGRSDGETVGPPQALGAPIGGGEADLGTQLHIGLRYLNQPPYRIRNTPYTKVPY